jgi:hypothetical protein
MKLLKNSCCIRYLWKWAYIFKVEYCTGTTFFTRIGTVQKFLIRTRIIIIHARPLPLVVSFELASYSYSIPTHSFQCKYIIFFILI